jgi:hypothetical protein
LANPGSFEEIQVFENIAQPTGNRFDRSSIRQRRGACRSLAELTAKWRRLGDGFYYLAASAWPQNLTKLDLRESRRPGVAPSSLF